MSTDPDMRMALAAQVAATGLLVGLTLGLIRVFDANRHDIGVLALRSLGTALCASLAIGAVVFRGRVNDGRGLLVRWLFVSWASSSLAALGAVMPHPRLVGEMVVVGAALGLPMAVTAAATYWLAARGAGRHG